MHRPRPVSRRLKGFLTGLVAFLPLLTGCLVGIGPRAVRQEHSMYNEQVVQTLNEQMLLNLVRLRYNDTPMFLDLGTIVAQYSVERHLNGNGGISFSAPGIAPQSGSLGISGGGTWAERPTVTMTPLQGEQFATELLTPIGNDSLILLSQTGWGIDRLLQVCVQRINEVGNASSATGPTPEESPRFEQMQALAKHLRRLQRAGLFAISHDPRKDARRPIFWLRKPKEPQSEYWTDLASVRQLLALPADKDEFYVSAYPFRRLPDEIGVRGRTLLGVLFYLSQAVEAPVEHLEKGLVGITRDEAGHEFNWVNMMEPIIRIRSDRDPPTGAFVSIRYRGYWFSIADNDRESKTTFNLLNLLFSMQTATAKGKSPMLTLPVGN